MTSREMLEREIAELEARLGARKKALAVLIKGESKLDSSAGTPETDVTIIEVIREILHAHGKPMRRKDLVQDLIDRGAGKNTQRGAVNIGISIKMNLLNGNLTVSEKGDLIGLPEWQTK